MVIRLNIGCGANLYPLPWVNIDHVDLYDDTVEEPKRGYLWHLKRITPSQVETWPEEQRRHVEWVAAGKLSFFCHDLRKGFPMYPEGCVEAIYCGQVIEHLQPIVEVPAFLAECFRLLRSGGRIRLTTPDLDKLVRDYMHDNGGPYTSLGAYASEQPAYYRYALPEDQLAYIMYGAGGTLEKYEGHQHLYTLRSLSLRLALAGFHVDHAEATKSAVFGDCVDKGLSHSLALEASKP